MRIFNKLAFTILLAGLILSACNDNDDQNIASSPPVVSHLAGSLGGPGSEDGPADQAGFYAPGGSLIHAGRLYVADTGNHTIRMVELATGQVTTVAGSPGQSGSTDGIGAAARFYYPRGLSCDGNRLYVSDSGNHTVRAIELASGQVATLAGTAGSAGSADGIGAAARFSRPVGLAVAGGRLYVADSSNHTVRAIELASGQVSTVAGSPGLNGSDNGIGAAARFLIPWGLASDGSNIYVADSWNNCIRQIVIATATVTTLAGTALDQDLVDGSGAAARFMQPMGLSYSAGQLYVADATCIRRIVIATATVTTLAGPLTPNADGYVDGSGAAARFSDTQSLCVDGANLYVADTSNNALRRIIIATGAVTTYAGHTNTAGSTDASGLNTRFYHPEGLALSDGRLYVADSFNHTLRMVEIASGAVTTLAGTAGQQGATDGIGAAARFKYPRGLACDGSRLYVTDSNNHTIRMVELASGQVTTIAGAAGASGTTDGIGAAARFNLPEGLACVGNRLFVADSSNHTIRVIDLATRAVTTLAGTAGQTGSTDGIGTAARFWRPASLVAADGRLYVSDMLAGTIRAVDLATAAVTTLAGAASQSGSIDGSGAAARFSRPAGLTTDGRRLFVADSSNHNVRQIDIATAAVTTLAGRPLRPGCQDGWAATAGFYGPLGLVYDTQQHCLYISDSFNNCVRRLGR